MVNSNNASQGFRTLNKACDAIGIKTQPGLHVGPPDTLDDRTDANSAIQVGFGDELTDADVDALLAQQAEESLEVFNIAAEDRDFSTLYCEKLIETEVTYCNKDSDFVDPCDDGSGTHTIGESAASNVQECTGETVCRNEYPEPISQR